LNALEKQLFERGDVQAEPFTVRRALVTLLELQGRLSDAEQRLSGIRADRDQSAYNAVAAPKGAPVSRHMEALRRAAAEVEQEKFDLQAAIRTAEEKVAAARERAEGLQRRADAERANELAGELDQLGVLAGEALIAVVTRIRNYQDVAAQCHRLGFGASPALIAANLKRSVSASLHAIGLGDLVPVSQRVEPGTLLAGYAQRVRDEASRALEDDEE